MKRMNNNDFLKETPAENFCGRDDEPGKRIGQMISPAQLDEIADYHCAIIGIPEYYGIVKNGGRLSFDGDKRDTNTLLGRLVEEGAPVSVRKRLYGMAPGGFPHTIKEELRIADLGDIQFESKNISQALDRLSDVLKVVYENGVIPIIIGGGHHISLASIGAFADRYKSTSIGVTVVDAHCDFRSYQPGEIHSGIPFRFLHDNYSNVSGNGFVEVGLRPERNAVSFIRDLQKWGATLVEIDSVEPSMISELIEINERADKIFLSVDIDAFNIKGASAPYPGGISARWGREAAFQWGQNSKTIGLDVLEVNPLIDSDSSDLAAQLIWSFLCGVSSNPEKFK